DVWFHSHPYDGRGQFRLLLNVGNSTVDCGYLSYESDPKFTEFTTLQVASDLQVNIQKKADLEISSISVFWRRLKPIPLSVRLKEKQDPSQ
ncbi:hypothetical protein M9458_009124, partial [Cirrhinus mrigala]